MFGSLCAEHLDCKLFLRIELTLFMKLLQADLFLHEQKYLVSSDQIEITLLSTLKVKISLPFLSSVKHLFRDTFDRCLIDLTNSWV